MTTKPIVESGMTFGPYPEGRCFHVENSRAYAAIQEGVKVAEFVLLREGKRRPASLWVVEARSSTPRPETQPNFDLFIAEIREKLVNAFSLVWACCLKRHRRADAELPDRFKAVDLSRADVKFVLVIQGHREEWLPPLQEALYEALRPTVKTWAFSPTAVAVMNDAMARERDLIRE